jgi:hypothetical protein
MRGTWWSARSKKGQEGRPSERLEEPAVASRRTPAGVRPADGWPAVLLGVQPVSVP